MATTRSSTPVPEKAEEPKGPDVTPEQDPQPKGPDVTPEQAPTEQAVEEERGAGYPLFTVTYPRISLLVDLPDGSDARRGDTPEFVVPEDAKVEHGHAVLDRGQRVKAANDAGQRHLAVLLTSGMLAASQA